MPLTDGDRNEITQLGGRYAQAIDSYEADTWADCFTDDGAFESDTQGRFQGRDALIWFVGTAKNFVSSAGMLTRHWTNHWVIDGDGDRARATSYAMLIDTLSGGRIIACGVYHDQLRKIDERWKFVERKWVSDGVSEEERAAIAEAFRRE